MWESKQHNNNGAVNFLQTIPDNNSTMAPERGPPVIIQQQRNVRRIAINNQQSPARTE